ncbi:MAG: hypothetical protein HRT45_14655 [Bdellovibrionales bacterium]|nr:hypothetical protein [Bdellovibrionales bacterium]
MKQNRAMAVVAELDGYEDQTDIEIDQVCKLSVVAGVYSSVYSLDSLKMQMDKLKSHVWSELSARLPASSKPDFEMTWEKAGARRLSSHGPRASRVRQASDLAR